MLVFVSFCNTLTKKAIGAVLLDVQRPVDVQQFLTGSRETESIEIDRYYKRDELIELGYQLE